MSINFCRLARQVYFCWMTKRAQEPRVSSTYLRRGLRDVWDWRKGERDADATSRGHGRAHIARRIGLAAGQGMPGDAGAQEKLNLSKSKEDMISQGLKSEPAQSSPGYRGDVGSK